MHTKKGPNYLNDSEFLSFLTIFISLFICTLYTFTFFSSLPFQFTVDLHDINTSSITKVIIWILIIFRKCGRNNLSNLNLYLYIEWIDVGKESLNGFSLSQIEKKHTASFMPSHYYFYNFFKAPAIYFRHLTKRRKKTFTPFAPLVFQSTQSIFLFLIPLTHFRSASLANQPS
jgi:hypothetical protein